MPCISPPVPAVIFKISPSSKIKVLSIIFSTVFAATAFLEIAKVAVAEVSVTWTDKATGLAELLSTCICLIKHLAPVGEVRTDTVPLYLHFYIVLSW